MSSNWPATYTPEFPGLVDFLAPPLKLSLTQFQTTGKIRRPIIPVPGATTKILNFPLSEVTEPEDQEFFWLELEGSAATLGGLGSNYMLRNNDFLAPAMLSPSSASNSPPSSFGNNAEIKARIIELKEEKATLKEKNSELKTELIKISQVIEDNDLLRGEIKTLETLNGENDNVRNPPGHGTAAIEKCITKRARAAKVSKRARKRAEREQFEDESYGEKREAKRHRRGSK